MIEGSYKLVKNFFTFNECDDFLENYKHIIDNTIENNIDIPNSYSNELKMGDFFYTKKDGKYILSKFNLPLESVHMFCNRISNFIKYELKFLKPFSFKIAQMVIKRNYDNLNMPPHTDNIFDNRKSYFNFGIYLTEGDTSSSVSFYENSETLKLSSNIPNIDYSKFNKKTIFASKGDMLIHNCYCIHESNSVNIKEGRKTLYLKVEINE